MSRPRKSRNPAGRPSRGLAEESVLVTGPALLLAAVEQRAAQEKITTREAWRRAARTWLGWHEVVPPSVIGGKG